jgi:hypothetical protein
MLQYFNAQDIILFISKSLIFSRILNKFLYVLGTRIFFHLLEIKIVLAIWSSNPDVNPLNAQIHKRVDRMPKIFIAN